VKGDIVHSLFYFVKLNRLQVDFWFSLRRFAWTSHCVVIDLVDKPANSIHRRPAKAIPTASRSAAAYTGWPNKKYATSELALNRI